MTTRELYELIAAAVAGVLVGRLVAELLGLGDEPRRRNLWRVAARNAGDLEEVRALAEAHDEELVQVHERLEGMQERRAAEVRAAREEVRAAGGPLEDRLERVEGRVAVHKGWLASLAERIERERDGEDGAPESDAHAVTPERERAVT